MRKFYFLAALSAVTLSASASEQIVTANHGIAGLNPATVSEYTNHSRISITDAQEAIPATPFKAANALKADSEDDFISIGTGTWVEGPLDYYSDIKSGVTHELEIFQSQSNPDLYRMTPYGEGSEPATILGKPNTNYFYVNVADPQKVVTYGDGSSNFFTPFNIFTIAQYVPEAGWPSTANGYGVYDDTDKTISFPANSFAIYSGSWTLTNLDGKFKIYLPGASVKDYSFSSDADLCNDDNKIRFIANVGADIATVKYIILAGTYGASANNLNIVADQGNTLTPGSIYTFTNNAAGIYTILIAATDADGNVVDGAAHWVHILADDTENWESIGTGIWNDPILVDAQYLQEAVSLNVDVQRNINDPNLLRVSSPYAVFNDYTVAHEGHEHYIYIDITNPDEVKVDLSLSGFATDSGHLRIWSVISRYTANTADELREYGYGVPSYDATTNTITFPAKSLQFSEPYYGNGSWFNATTEGSLILPEEEDNTTPEALYITGDFNEPVALTKDGDIFTISDLHFVAGEGATTCSFHLTDAAADATRHYGAISADGTLTSDIVVEFATSKTADEAYSWTVEPGYYDVEVDFARRTIVLHTGTSTIDTVGVESADRPVEYFNLQGIRVNEPTSGLYIIRQGSTTAKQLVK